MNGRSNARGYGAVFMAFLLSSTLIYQDIPIFMIGIAFIAWLIIALHIIDESKIYDPDKSLLRQKIILFASLPIGLFIIPIVPVVQSCFFYKLYKRYQTHEDFQHKDIKTFYIVMPVVSIILCIVLIYKIMQLDVPV